MKPWIATELVNSISSPLVNTRARDFARRVALSCGFVRGLEFRRQPQHKDLESGSVLQATAVNGEVGG
jgi:hypothetical protein